MRPINLKKRNTETAIAYHNRSKHFPARFARSPGYMDWQTQPNQFRSFEGAEIFKLDLNQPDPDSEYRFLYQERESVVKEFTAGTIGKFLELSLGLSAWKSYGGESWPLRMNPSSGNLHAEETYLLLPAIKEFGGEAGLFHYNPEKHILEKRAGIGGRLWENLAGCMDGDGFYVALSAIYWREAWKYGERAFRYCNLDTGHAVACVSLSANLMGWKVTCLNKVSGEELSSLLGYGKTDWYPYETEEAELLLFIHGRKTDDPSLGLPAEALQQFAETGFAGRPNILSSGHTDWKVIEDVSVSTRGTGVVADASGYAGHPCLDSGSIKVSAAAIIRQRRSGQSYDGKTGMTAQQFFSIMDRTVPRKKCTPFDVRIGSTSIHLLLFVHRVESLAKGLYFLFRNDGDVEAIKEKSDSGFLWKKVDGSPENLSFYLLKEGDLTASSSIISCRQDIAGDGAFSVGMIARFRDNLEADPHSYRRLFWEAGMVGQVLYLEAEAHGLRGTGIGCYFDDMVHELLSLRDDSFQDLYHFTIGRDVEDTRLETLAPYHHLER